MTAELKQSAATGTPDSSWKPYPAYRDSGVEWLGKVPEHWEVSTIKRIVANHMQGYYSNQDYVSDGVKLLRITDIDDFSNINFSECPFVLVNEKEISDFGLEINDFLFARSGTIGRFGILRKKEKAVFASYLIRFRFSKKLDADFLKYYFFSEYFKQSLISDLHGGANQNIHAENIKNQIITIPSYPEQRAISLYLDDRTQKINSLIEKKQNLIDLLKEERTAIINQAVTKGLNPDAPMKDSGIEWLGEIPKHWEAKRLKYVAKIVLGKMLTNDDKGGYFYKPYLRAQNISWQEINIDDVKHMWFSEKELDQYRVKLNDLLVSEGGEVGRTAIWNNVIEECYIQNSVHKVTMLYGSNPYYFMHLFFLYGQIGYFDSIVSRVSIAHLTREKLKEVFCLIPSIAEQNQIVKYIENESAKTDRTISRIEKEITLLQEYRTSLISEVITGKIDVREAV